MWPWHESAVVVYQAVCAEYPNQAPFHPLSRYPEYAWDDVGVEPNFAYDAVRACLSLAQLDSENYGTLAWNPLRGLIALGI